MEIWVKLNADDAIVEAKLNSIGIVEGAVLADLKINDINSIVLGTSILKYERGIYSIDNSKGVSKAYADEQKAIEDKKKQDAEYRNELENLTSWFSEYDLQISEYNRDIALGISPTIHIGDKTYSTITDLYEEARANASRISDLRSLLG